MKQKSNNKQAQPGSFEEFRVNSCDDKVILKKTNLTDIQQVGKKRLRNKLIKNEIFIANTDKSGKYVLTRKIWKFDGKR